MYRLEKGNGPFDPAQGRPMPTIQGGDLDVANEEPLKLELADFIDAVAKRRAPVVSGEEGRRALAVAQQITDKIRAPS